MFHIVIVTCLLLLFFYFFLTFFVDWPTGENKTLVEFHVKEAYSASALPPLGRSDHILLFIQPRCKPCLLRQSATGRRFRRWSPEASHSQRHCLECMDWNVLLESQGNIMDIDRMVDCTTHY